MIKRKPKPASDIDKYLSEVQSWETDRVHMEQKSRQTAWRVAGVSLFLACLCVGAVAALVPLKTVEPFVVRVDNTTGVVDVVHTLKGGDTTYNESVNKYFAQIYVRAREGYFREMADVNYKAVGLLSGNTEQQRYFDYCTPKNPQSPLVVYGKYAKVNITIKSASFIKPNVALVRFVKEVVRGPDKPELSHWASTVTFKYSLALVLTVSEKIRGVAVIYTRLLPLINPLSWILTKLDSSAPANVAPVVRWASSQIIRSKSANPCFCASEITCMD